MATLTCERHILNLDQRLNDSGVTMNFAKKKVNLKNQLSVQDFFSKKKSSNDTGERSTKKNEENESNLNRVHNIDGSSSFDCSKKKTSKSILHTNTLSSSINTKRSFNLTNLSEENYVIPVSWNVDISLEAGALGKRATQSVEDKNTKGPIISNRGN